MMKIRDVITTPFTSNIAFTKGSVTVGNTYNFFENYFEENEKGHESFKQKRSAWRK